MADESVNARLRDEVLAHLIDLHRYGAGEARRAVRVLNEADIALFTRLREALERAGLDTSNFTVQRLSAALHAVWQENEAAYRQLQMRNAAEMRELTLEELSHSEDMFRALLPAGARDAVQQVVARDAVHAAATARPMQGRLMSEWWGRLEQSRRDRIETQLRTGFLTGQTVDEMVRELRGTRAANYEDGTLQEDRRNVEAVVRTAVGHYAAAARESFYSANTDLISAEQWISTLDNRTTHECQIRDRLKYTPDEEHKPIGHKVPWLEGPGRLHWNCRSTSVPIIRSAEVLGFELPPVERAAMNGVAAPDTTFRTWIEAQPAARQEDILGPTRTALLRRGGLRFSELFSAEGEWLTLDELRQRRKAAFRAADL